MDAYTSLLNLNFMYAWRTGNSLIDMIIAIIIPLVSNWVASFFSVSWPGFVRGFLQWFIGGEVQVKIQHGLSDRYQRAVDLTEGSVLQDAIERYVSEQLKPFYANGEYIYSMVAPSDTVGKKTMAQVLRQDFKLLCRPVKESVELGNNIVLRIRELDDEEPDSSSESVAHKGYKKRIFGEQAKARMREILLTSKARGGGSEGDEVLAFVKEAFRWHVDRAGRAVVQQRYLFQPIRKVDFTDDSDSLMKVARYPLFDLKSFNSLFFPEKEKLMALIDQFENKTGKFAVPGFPHKLTLLLHGPPGTGKTSLVKAIAQHTGRHIFSVPLGQVHTNHELIACMHDQLFEVSNEDDCCRVSLRPEKVIYLLEDADATGDVMLKNKMKNSAMKTSEGMKLSPLSLMDALNTKGLLDAFGGILDSPKRIIIMTTNHIERLDSALIRPGFITMRLHMGNFTKEYAAQMVRHYYGDEVATEEHLESLKNVLQEASEANVYFSPSEMEQLCADYDDIGELIQVLRRGSREEKF